MEMLQETTGIVCNDGISHAAAPRKRSAPCRNARKTVEDRLRDRSVDDVKVTEERGVNRVDHAKGRASEKRPDVHCGLEFAKPFAKCRALGCGGRGVASVEELPGFGEGLAGKLDPGTLSGAS